MKNLRIRYTILFIVFLMIEIAIALYIHDDFVRPYIGDVLVVVVIYCLVRILIPKGYSLMPIYIFLFAAFVEALQYFNLVQILGLEDNTFVRILLGSTFDWMDILCYGIGCICIYLAGGVIWKLGKY